MHVLRSKNIGLRQTVEIDMLPMRVINAFFFTHPTTQCPAMSNQDQHVRMVKNVEVGAANC